MPKSGRREESNWKEEFSVGRRHLASFVERLLAQGNVRRLVIVKPSGGVLLESSLTTAIAVVGLFTIMAPVLTAIAAIAALLVEVRVKVVYIGKPPRH